MGQAKQRGTPEQRRDAAIEAMRQRLPKSVTCNNCQATLTDIQPMNVRGMEGLRAAGEARCEACGHITMAVDGEPEALAQFAEYMQREKGALVGRAVGPHSLRK